MASLDELVGQFGAAFQIPGLAVAVVSPGGDPRVAVHGVRTLGRSEPVDPHTAFAIGSNTKPFTAAALALLVDAGELAWDDPVSRHLPEFRMSDPVVTQLMTVRDLLVHHSGLKAGAGDLLYIPTSDRSAADILAALPKLSLRGPFRGSFAYDNILYIVAGLLIERVTGMSWRAFVTTRLLQPLGMVDAAPGHELAATDNLAGRHARLGPPVRGLGAWRVVAPSGETEPTEPAGGVHASACDLVNWLSAQLKRGLAPTGERVWSETQAAEMWKPHTIVASTDGATPTLPTRSVTTTYGLGWFIRDYRGHRLVSHSGGVSGQGTETALIPSLGLGVAVLANAETSAAAYLRNAVLDHLLEAPAFDWPGSATQALSKLEAEAAAAVRERMDAPRPDAPALPLCAYTGRYQDSWYGGMEVREEAGELYIAFEHTPALQGRLIPWRPEVFRTSFTAEDAEDALVTFIHEDGVVTRVAMEPFSPLCDFSLGYQDLDFRREGEPQG